MQLFNPFIYNIYTLLFNEIRLTLLAICLLLCLSFVSCSNSENNQPISPQKQVQVAENAININLATAEELEKLPRIGKGIAQRIIEYREKYGKFRRPENLIFVRGMSDKKFRELQNLIRVE